MNYVVAMTLLIMYVIYKEKIIVYIPIIEALRQLLLWHSAFVVSRWYFIILYTIVFTTIIYNGIRYTNNIYLKKELKKYYSSVIVFILFLLFGLFRTTEFLVSFEHVWKYSIIVLALPASIIYFYNNKATLTVYIKSTYIGVVIIIFTIFISTILKLGHIRGYVESSSIYFGWIELSALFPIVYLGLFTIFLSITSLKNNKKGLAFNNSIFNIIWILVVLLFIYVLLFVGKREYIYLFIIGIVTYNIIVNKYNIIKYVMTAILLVTVLAFMNYSGITENIKRTAFIERVQEKNVYEEGRYLEYVDYINEFQNNDINFLLFGKEIFNSRGNFFQYSKILFDRDRVLHSDITHFLYGIGITGLAVFLFLLYKVFLLGHKIYKTNKRVNGVYFYWALFISIYVMSFAHNFTGGLFTMNNKIIQWQLMGVLLSIILNKNLDNSKNN